MNRNDKVNSEYKEPFSSFEKMDLNDLKKQSKTKKIKNFLFKKNIFNIWLYSDINNFNYYYICE